MRKTLALLSLSLTLALSSSFPAFAGMALQLINQANVNTPDSQPDLLGLDDQLWGNFNQRGDKQALLNSIDNSLRYIKSAKAIRDYQNYPIPGITRDRVRRSLLRFRQLLVSARTPAQLQAAVKQEFDFYQSVGNDEQGTVLFTGYYQPVHKASRRRTAEYRYPIYRMPPGFASWSKPHPTRAELEGDDGLQGSSGRLRGMEIFWLRDRLEAYLVQVEGSARLQLTDGTTTGVGYAGATDYPYTSLGKELGNDGRVELQGLTLPVVVKYFQDNPTELNKYIPRNQRFVFFEETRSSSAKGSIAVPVTPDRSIATDKSIMPPGALALISAQIPYPNANGQIESRLVNRYVLDQDTGSAIKGAGRVDYFMGTGKLAGDRAAVINGNGQLYYLLLKQ